MLLNKFLNGDIFWSKSDIACSSLIPFRVLSHWLYMTLSRHSWRTVESLLDVIYIRTMTFVSAKLRGFKDRNEDRGIRTPAQHSHVQPCLWGFQRDYKYKGGNDPHDCTCVFMFFSSLREPISSCEILINRLKNRSTWIHQTCCDLLKTAAHVPTEQTQRSGLSAFHRKHQGADSTKL